MTNYSQLNVKNEIIDDILERKTNGVSPLLHKKKIASKFNFVRNLHDLMYFGSLPLLFFIWTKRNSGRLFYYSMGGLYFVTYFGLSFYRNKKYEETKNLLCANDEDFEKKVSFYASFVRDKYDPYERLPQK